MVPTWTMHSKTMSSDEGVSPCRNWTLSRTEVEVRMGADLPKPPQERGGACRSQASDPGLLYFMRAQASAETESVESRCPGGLLGRNGWRRRVRWVLILVVMEASSMVAMPFDRPGLRSAIKGGGVSEGSGPRVLVKTKVHAGVVSGMIGGRSWSSTEVPVGGAMVALISWIPLSEGET